MAKEESKVMADYDSNKPSDSIKDRDTDVGHDAKDAADRFAALQYCLANNWDDLDIGRLERKDTNAFHGWLMWHNAASGASKAQRG
jgi:hypothetical protein